MATKLLPCFLNHTWIAVDCNHSNVRFPVRYRRLLPASCKMRQRNFSSQHKRQQSKKIFIERPPTDANLDVHDDEDAELDKVSTDNSVSSLNQDFISSDDVGQPPADAKSQRNGDEDTVPENVLTDSISGLNQDFIISHDVDSSIPVQYSTENDLKGVRTEGEKTLAVNLDGGEHLSSIQLKDLISMIRNAEKNILLLNQARVHALEDLEKILSEKKTLQGEINILEMRLAETDDRIKVTAQEKIHVELLEDELEKLQNELANRGDSEGSELDVHEKNKILNDEASELSASSVNSLSKELSYLMTENKFLKDDIQELKTQLTDVKRTDKRVLILEKERSVLESTLKDLESKLSFSQEDVSKLSALKFEFKELWQKVENLQLLLDRATKQADQAISVLQQNQELRKKVDRLEESLEEANVYKLSSEKVQQYNELVQQKLILLEERLDRSDEEIHSCVQLYQESMKEFQDTLDSLREESKRALDEPVDDMPIEFWSRLLLIVDGWLIEKKISTNDAKLLREMVWTRDERIRDAYVTCMEKNEQEAVATFLRLIFPSACPGLHVIQIAAEIAPVAKDASMMNVYIII